VPQDIFKKGDYMPKTVELTSVNWTITEPDLTKSYEARSRYRQQKQTCRISKGNSGQYSVSFDQPQTALTPGQSIVIYSGSKCIGGGILS
jgi:tRNA-specific 2-thiouridylase